MRVVLNIVLFLIALAFAVGERSGAWLAPAALAASQTGQPAKKAKWIQPAKKTKAKPKAKSKKNAKKATAKKRSTAKKKSASKAISKTATSPKKPAPSKAVPKQTKPIQAPKQAKSVQDPKQEKPVQATPKKAPTKELTVAPSITDEDIDNYEERRTSPWLYVFIAFVLACVGGMLFINSRRRNLEAARVNFRDYTSNHEVAFNSRNSDLDMPAQSGHEAPTTSTLFARTDDIRQAGREPRSSLLGRISSKASGLLSSSRSRTKTREGLHSQAGSVSDTAANFAANDDESSFGSITTISAVRASSGRADTRAPADQSTFGMAEPLVANVQGEPCSFERYVEIQVATQCWKSKEIAIGPRLQEIFGISTEDLIQFEFYWKQKISGNINLRKKFEELEPLYSAKYEAA